MTPESILEVFNHWRIIMGHERARMDIKRAQVIRERLKDGYTVEDLQTAIEGCAATAWNMGENPGRVIYDSITLILRDADHVERFMQAGEIARKMIASMQERQRVEYAKAEKGPPSEEEKQRVRELLKTVRLRRVA